MSPHSPFGQKIIARSKNISPCSLGKSELVRRRNSEKTGIPQIGIQDSSRPGPGRTGTFLTIRVRIDLLVPASRAMNVTTANNKR
jgi:hypothetical protein